MFRRRAPMLQWAMLLTGSRGPASALCIADLRDVAKRRLPRALFEYVDRGAEDERAVNANRSALDELKIRPRVLRGVAQRSAERMLFGAPMRLPLAVAPTAVAGLLWYDGDVISARAAASAGVPYTLSTFSVTALERVAAAVPNARLWFQLYVSRNRDHMRALVDRAREAGCEALVLTVDGPVAPKREYNIRNGFSIPVRLSGRLAWDVAMHPSWLLGVAARYQLTSGFPRMAHQPGGGGHEPDAAVTWDTVRELRELFPGRLLLKGLLHPDDARLASDAGVDAIVVSNHGGRNLDASLSTVDALPAVVDAVEGRLPVLVDGAFQRGSDIVKALALGASAVLVGRSILWGAASYGEAGVHRSLEILHEELDRVMAQVGSRHLDELSPTLLWRPPA